jgi:hypothetical protein
MKSVLYIRLCIVSNVLLYCVIFSLLLSKLLFLLRVMLHATKLPHRWWCKVFHLIVYNYVRRHSAPTLYLRYTRGVQVELGLGTFNFTGIKTDASVAVVHAVVKWQVCPIADRRRTCRRPVQGLLIKMAVLVHAWNHQGWDRH